MKLPDFSYAVPATLGEALELLRAGAGGAKPLAGGQSLVPALAFRLAAPTMLVDLRRLPGLGEIRIDARGVELGAKVRWRDILDHPRLQQAQPLLAEAVRHVAHYQIRNRGTVGGSLAHADPAAELPGIAVTCDARVVVAARDGSREVPAAEFFTGPLSTMLAPDELIVALRFPAWPEGRRFAFEELSRRRGDFAIAGVALFYDLDRGGWIVNAHVGVIGACHRPHRLSAAEAALEGAVADDAVVGAAAEAGAAEVDPPGDLHASAAYRRALVGTLLERALRRTLA
jgi:carbon-monoxide dehydrogenase medium subunit